MKTEIENVPHRETKRGTALLAAGGVMVLLTWVLPAVAPFAVAAYGAYQLFNRQLLEGGIAIGLALILWLARGLVGGLLWLIGAGLVAAGLFFLIKSLRGAQWQEY